VQLPRYLSSLLLRRLERRGVEVIPHTAIKYLGRGMRSDMRAVERAEGDAEPPVRVSECVCARVCVCTYKYPCACLLDY
jgi:hypothetical protein